ncbi:MAG: hypothetical protein NTY19_28125 [Planctomycetota bacterium]|nr:hypothetical protein [Planctomycetota bacterium]
MTVVSPKARQTLDLGTAVLLAIFVGMGLFLLWLGLFYRARNPDAAEAATSFGVPVGTPNVIRCHFTGLAGSTKAVILDRSQNTIHFDGCFVPRKLLARTVSTFQCPLVEIVVVYAYHSRACQMLKIVTVSGIAEIPERTATGFAELREVLSCYGQPNRPGYALDSPALNAFQGLVYFGGTLAGLVAGLYFVPRVASAGTMALAMLGGGFCGVVAIKLLVHGVYRWWRVELVKPLGCGVGGAALALIVGAKLGPFVGWDWRVTIAPIPLAFIGGVTLGLMLNRRKAASGAGE